MDAYNLVDNALKIFLCVLAALLLIGSVALIIHYLRIIADHWIFKSERLNVKEIEKRIYGEDDDY